MALTKIKLDSMVTGTLPDANIPDDITITGLSGENSGDNAVNTNYSGLAVTSSSVTDGTNTFNKATDFVSATSGGTFGGVVNIQKSSSAGAGVVDDFIQIKRTDTTNVLNRYTGILFTDSNTQGSAIRNIRTNYEQHYQNDLAFSTNVAGSDNSLSEVMRLTGDGNVGIGCTPSSRLDVDSKASGTVLQLRDTVNASYPLIFESTGTRNWRIKGESGADYQLTIENVGSANYGLKVVGDVTVDTGNLVIGTAGKGIDFSAQSPSSATGATTGDEVLDHYEEGTWTPTLPSGGEITVYNAVYTRTGRNVWYSFYATVTPDNNSLEFQIGGLPFVVAGSSHYPAGSVGYTGGKNTSSWHMPLSYTGHSKLYIHQNSGTQNTVPNSWANGASTGLIMTGEYTT